MRNRPLKFAVIILMLTIFLFEGYTLIVRREGELPIPAYFGNSHHNIAALEGKPAKAEFEFAIMGDTKSLSTFERLSEELRKLPLDFAVLLGDVTYSGTEEAHRYLRAELSEYEQPFPVFYVAGNHDVSLDEFPVSRFEQLYGPTVFSFEYQGCLFIVLRVLDEPFSNEESIRYVEHLKNRSVDKYRRIFVFMHIPPPLSSYFIARKYHGAEQFVQLFDQIGVDYVFAGDYHGYARVKQRNTTYIVSGGGGARLSEKIGKQFHHALLLRVTHDSVSERFVHVENEHDMEDFFERAAVVYVWPWMAQNWVLVSCANGSLLVVLFLALRPHVSVRPASRSAGSY